MQIAIFGAGLVGRRTAGLLAANGFDVVLVAQAREATPLQGVTVAKGWPNPAAQDADICVLATESAHQPALAAQLIRAGTHVVSTADNPADIRRLWAMNELARRSDAALVVGAAYSPGISTLLASHLARSLDTVDTISTAQFGTGGPACAREHHRAMSSEADEVHQGALRTSRGGTGRELVWFPDPIGAADCYRAGLADPFLLHQAFPLVRRVESRQAATRRDRLTARLPMLRSPHPEGLIGAVWAEVRGQVDGSIEHRALAATAPQATGAAAMAAGFCQQLASEFAAPGTDAIADRGIRSGVRSAAIAENSVPLMELVSNDVRLWAYDGSQIDAISGGTGQIHAARKWTITNENRVLPTFL